MELQLSEILGLFDSQNNPLEEILDTCSNENIEKKINYFQYFYQSVCKDSLIQFEQKFSQLDVQYPENYFDFLSNQVSFGFKNTHNNLPIIKHDS